MQPSFDPYQFADSKAYPASAETCIAFADYERMHTEQHKLAPERKNETPHWAHNETALRELLVRFLEARAFMNRAQPRGIGTQRERLERACAKLRERVPAKIEVLRDRCRSYVALRNSGAPDAKLLRMAEVEIKNLDRELRMTARIAEIVVGVVYFYHCCGLNSVETAARLHLSPCGVRQILWRLQRTWSRMNQKN